MSRTFGNIDEQNIWHPFSPLKGGDDIIEIDRGEGVYLYTPEGDQILDAVSSWWVNIHGHANKELAKAIYDQASRLEHVIFAGFTHKPAADLSENILSIVPGNMNKVFFSDDGSTSVEVAIKLALQYWELIGEDRKTCVALDGAYHGDTFGAMSVGARGSFNVAFEPYLFDAEFLPFPTDETCVEKFRAICEKEKPACFIYEPLLQGSAGMRMYSPETLQKLLEVAREFGVICIADEVMTGFGRTGKNFASEYCTIAPDIMCLSKGITGGTLPLGFTVVGERITSEFESRGKKAAFYHGHSYTGNPIICAAAVKSYEIFVSDECQNNIKRVSEKQAEAQKRFAMHDRISNSRNRGTVLALEIATDESSSYFNSIRDVLYKKFLERSILLRPLGNTIYVLPPYVITNEELDHIYDVIEEVLAEL